jgi:hypothetical protein
VTFSLTFINTGRSFPVDQCHGAGNKPSGVLFQFIASTRLLVWAAKMRVYFTIILVIAAIVVEEVVVKNSVLL